MANGVGEILNEDYSEWRYFSVARNTVAKITSANFSSRLTPRHHSIFLSRHC